MPKDQLHLDYETFSEVDLPKVGSSRYLRHESTEVLMCAWSINDVVQKQWVPAEDEPMPAAFREALESPDVVKWAWNAPFEIQASRHVLGLNIDHTQWRDTMVLALTCSLPGKLEKAGPVVGLPEDKIKLAKGKRLMKKFSSPRKPTQKNPSTRLMPWDAYLEWEEYLEYNARDELSERSIYHKLKAYNLPDHEWDLWHLDQKINTAGIPINIKMVRNAITIYETEKRQRLLAMNDITGLQNSNSGAQLLPWLKDQGYPFDDIKAGHIKRAHEKIMENADDLTIIEHGPYIEALEHRKEIAKTSPKKYHALLRASDQDAVIRYCFQFAGAARTWRWGGRIYQPQNLPRPNYYLEKLILLHAQAVERCDWESLDLIYPSIMELLATCIRPAAQAPDGYVFVDADLNAIENRILGWLANCAKILNVFKLKRDPYIDFATYLFHQPYDVLMAEYKAGNSKKRTISKPGVLGCGYLLGPGDEYINQKTGEREASGLLGYAWNMGVTQFTLADSQLSVETFRREFEEVTDYWKGIESAAKQCVRYHKPVEFGHITFDIKGPFMRMLLPSGRALHYCRPRLEEAMMPWGKKKMVITYEGLDDRKVWKRISTHPGKLTENADQGIARDVIAHGMTLADREGLDLRIHVHDQAVALVKEDEAEDKLVILRQCMEEVPRWAPGLPLGSAGFISKAFIKD